MRSDKIHTVYGTFPAHLNLSSLSGICVKENGVQTGPFGSQLHQKDYVDNGIPIITVEHLGDNKIVHIDTPFVSDNDYNRLIKYNLKKGDIVFSRVGSVDRRALVGEDEDGWLFSGRCLRVRPNNKIVDSTYLSYFFGLNVFKKYVRSIAVGATMPSINTKILSGLPIVYPPLPTQKKIAHILSTLDDKIELNRKMNETLEAMAQALFKSWFIDFDPVHAKVNAAGREDALGCKAACKSEQELKVAAAKLGISKETLDLFPSEFEESEMGMMPKGWEVESLIDLIDITGGGTPKRSVDEFWNGTIPWFSVKDTPRDGDIFVINTMEKITETGLSKSSAKLLSTGTTIITARGTVGNLALTAFPMSMNQSCYGIKGKEFGDLYIYFLMKSVVNDLKQNVHGAVFDTITTNTFSIINAIIPSVELYSLFDKMALPLLENIKSNLYEITTLQKTRDTLLPKLLVGELDVSGVEVT